MGKSTHASRVACDEDHDGNLRRTVMAVVAGERPEHVLELYYWTRNPAVLQLVRAFAAVDCATKKTINVFLSQVKDLRAISANIDRSGSLRISAQNASATLAMPENSAAPSQDSGRKGSRHVRRTHAA
jgi:hypothetical protein